MGIRTRKFIGTIVLVAFLVVYAVVAMTIGAARINDQSVLVQTLFYLVAGLAWVIPAALLIRWMQRP
jgi:hypothetical protein